MNDYEKQQQTRGAEFERELQAITDQLGPDWEVKPWDGEGYAPMWRNISDRTCYRVIWCHWYRAGSQDRIEFKCHNWAHYEDETGNKRQVWPHDLYPKETAPICTAARGRDPKAVANQIRKLLPEYDRIWALCAQRAEESGAYYSETADAIRKLAEATGNEYKQNDSYHSYFLRGLGASSTQSVKFNSVGDVEIRLPTDEMLKVIDLIYKLRIGRGCHSKLYSACPDCGCTDIEVSAWVHDNTGEVIGTGNEGPTDQYYCPQCADSGGDLQFSSEGISKTRFLTQSMSHKPYVKGGA